MPPRPPRGEARRRSSQAVRGGSERSARIGALFADYYYVQNSLVHAPAERTRPDQTRTFDNVRTVALPGLLWSALLHHGASGGSALLPCLPPLARSPYPRPLLLLARALSLSPSLPRGLPVFPCQPDNQTASKALQHPTLNSQKPTANSQPEETL